MRRALIGAIVAVVGIAATLGVSYAAGARSGKDRHALCAKASRSKDEQAKRRAKCKKVKPAADGQKVLGQRIGLHAASPAAAPAVAPTPTALTTATPGSALPSGAAATTTAPAGTEPAVTPPPMPPFTWVEPVPEPAYKVIPRGVSEMTLVAETGKWGVGRTLTEPEALARMIAAMETLTPMPAGTSYECPSAPAGTLTIKMQFREPLQPEPVAKAIDATGGCDMLAVSVHGVQSLRLQGSRLVGLTGQLLGLELG